jgi:hypothetical protein
MDSQNERTEAERTLLWMLWKLDPITYAKYHADALMEHLHTRAALVMAA